jgi:hypothetical protein
MDSKERKRLREKKKMLQNKSKINQGQPQGKLPQREERLRKTFFVFLI